MIDLFIHVAIVIWQWVSKAKTVSPEMNAVWEQVNQVKTGLIELIDSDNDGWVVVK